MKNETILPTVRHKPRPLEQLGGREGILLTELAEAVGTKHAEMRQKIERSFKGIAKYLNLRTVAVATHHKNSKLPFTTYAMDTITAKMFLAKWDSPKGWDYLKYLLLCERIAEVEFRKAVAERDQAITHLKQVTKPKVIQRKGETFIRAWEKIVFTDVFGLRQEHMLPISRPFSQLTDAQLEEYRIKHRQKTISGICKAQDKSHSKVIMLPDPEQLTVSDKKPEDLQ